MADPTIWIERYREMLFDEKISHKQIGKYISTYLPKTLYRYRRFNSYWKDEIFDGIVHVSKSSELNDPFDCLTYVNKSEFYNHIDHKAADILKKNNINFYNVLDRKQIDDLGFCTNELKNLVRVASFTETKDNQLMWSHYADSHMGFCIEYNFKKVKLKNRNFIFPVLYSEERYDATYDMINQNENNYVIPFFIKSDAWKYEKEWRVIYSSEGGAEKEYNISFTQIISAIYLGVNANKNEGFDGIKREILDWANKTGIRVYQMRINEKTFDIYPEKIQ